MPVFDIDVGNSRVKWRSGVNERGVCAQSDLAPLLAGVAALQPARIRVASVAGDGFNARLAEELIRLCETEPEFAVTTRACAGVECGYDRPETMGVDRWLALLAAWTMAPGALMVVSAGTALTVDALMANGRHQGGYIVPGLRLMQRSLGQHTADVQVTASIDSATGTPRFGRTTQEAVQHGIVRMTSALTEAAIADFAAVAGGQPRLFLAGGDAPLLNAQLRTPCTVVPDLVLDGLAVALP